MTSYIIITIISNKSFHTKLPYYSPRYYAKNINKSYLFLNSCKNNGNMTVIAILIYRNRRSLIKHW